MHVKYYNNIQLIEGIRARDEEIAYRNPSDQEVVRVGVSIPILDWGLSESEYKLAQMQQEVVNASIEQAEVDFRETILITADEFSLKKQFVEGAEEADTIAKVAYDITRRRYLNGMSFDGFLGN